MATPLTQTLWTAVAVAVSAAIVLWLTFGQYTRRQHVTGRLVPQGGLIDVAARTSGVIESVKVKAGDYVRKGDILAVLTNERVSLNLGATTALSSKELSKQAEQLSEDIVNTNALSNRQREALIDQQSNLVDQIKQLDQQISYQQQLVKGYGSLLDRIAPLGAKGYVSAIQIQEQSAAKINAELQLTNLSRQRLETVQQIKAIGAQLGQLPLSTSSKENELKRQQSQVRLSLGLNEAERAIEIRAPMDGRITSVTVTTGLSISSGDHLLFMVPQGELLRAQLLVPSSAIGFIQTNEVVALRYKAYPYQKFGLKSGRISEVDRSALTADEVSNLIGQKVQESYYRVFVKLSSQTITVYGRKENLLPGMELDADVLLDRRSIFEWILEPLSGMKKRAKYDGDNGSGA